MKKLLAIPLFMGLVSGVWAGDSYQAPDFSFKAEPIVIQSSQARDNWSKGMDYRVHERPIIVREIASEKKEAGRNPSSSDGRKIQYMKFVPQPWYYTRD